MTVAELIAHLQTLPQDIPVVLRDDSEGSLFLLEKSHFEVDSEYYLDFPSHLSINTNPSGGFTNLEPIEEPDEEEE